MIIIIIVVSHTDADANAALGIIKTRMKRLGFPRTVALVVVHICDDNQLKKDAMMKEA